jgi:hypothetical protein
MQTMEEMTFPEFEALMNATYAAANWDWKQTAHAVVVNLASKRVPFTTDDVWQVLDALPVETKARSAIGPLMRKCESDGVIRNTGVLRRSRRAVNHRDKCEWIGCAND